MLVVTTASDEFGENDGACALREAIQVANTQVAFGGCEWNGAPLTIELPAGTYSLSRAGAGEDANATGDLDVVADLALEGAGVGATVVDGVQQDRLLHIAEGVTVEVSGLTLTGGRTADGTEEVLDAEPGGGIYNAGTLTLRDCTVSGNATGDGGETDEKFGDAGHGGDGGGIYNADSAVLTLVECAVQSNMTGDGGSVFIGFGGDAGNGGGIYNAGGVTLYRSALSGNRPGENGEGDGFYGNGGQGGGLFSEGGNVSIEESQISNNRTSNDPTTGYLSPGGGIAVLSGSVQIERSTLSQNQTRAAGGGLYMDGDTLRVANSTFSGNGAYLRGAGLALFTSTWATLDNLTITENAVDGDPDQGASGGGLYVSSSTSVEVRNSILAENRDLYSFPGPGFSDCGGSPVSRGYNVVGNGLGCALDAQATDQSGTWTPDDDNRLDPRLSSLLDHGGPTHTHLPFEDSPAVDAGSCVDIAGDPVGADQRGIERPLGATCDVGSVERAIPPIAVEPGVGEGVARYRLSVYPNPVRSLSAVELVLETGTSAKVSVYDVLGREVAVFHEGALQAGTHEWLLDGQTLPSGLYLIRLTSEQLSVSKRVTVLR